MSSPSSSSRRLRRFQPSTMLLRTLPSPRWLLFGLISAGYFIFTIVMLSYSQEACPARMGTSDGAARGNDDDMGQLKIHADGKIIDTGYDEQLPEHDTKVTGKTFNLGPLGKAIVAPEKKQQATPDTKTLFKPDVMAAKDLLDPKLVNNVVYMVWCGKRWFEFHNYMSVVSVIKHLRPDNIIFYYNDYPVLDYWLYNTWFDEIRDMYPFFQIEKLPANSNGCIDHSLPNMTFINHLLTTRGGTYINENTILAKYPFELRLTDFVFALNPNTMHGFISARIGLPGKNTISQILKDPGTTSKRVDCVGINTYNQARSVPVCVVSDGVFYPKDIWVDPSDFSRLIRTLFYGNPAPVDAKPSSDELIPNIAHVVWIGGGRMDYLFYLGMLSLLYVAEVDVVYLHGNAPPSGDLWGRIKDNPRIKLIYRESPKTVYGQGVRVLSHITDIWRVEFMIRYGGIYVDTDTIFVKKLDKEIRSYDAVGSYDWTYWNAPFPDTINFGVAIGKRNAQYWHKFQETMKWFIDDDWAWNGLRQPYKVKERHPHLVRIDPHLQVICYQYKCHPTWWPDYHNESIHHMNSPSIRDWRNDAYAFHWTLPTPPELESEELLLKSQTMAAEVGRHVLQKAGILDQIRAKYGLQGQLDLNKNHKPKPDQMKLEPGR